MEQDSRIPIDELRVDGGMVANELLMQFQADMLGVPVVRPRVTETTALGAAYAAGLAVGYWSSRDELKRNWGVDKRWTPSMGDPERARLYCVVAKGGHALVRLGRSAPLSDADVQSTFGRSSRRSYRLAVALDAIHGLFAPHATLRAAITPRVEGGGRARDTAEPTLPPHMAMSSMPIPNEGPSRRPDNSARGNPARGIGASDRKVANTLKAARRILPRGAVTY